MLPMLGERRIIYHKSVPIPLAPPYPSSCVAPRVPARDTHFSSPRVSESPLVGGRLGRGSQSTPPHSLHRRFQLSPSAKGLSHPACRQRHALAAMEQLAPVPTSTFSRRDSPQSLIPGSCCQRLHRALMRALPYLTSSWSFPPGWVSESMPHRISCDHFPPVQAGPQ